MDLLKSAGVVVLIFTFFILAAYWTIGPGGSFGSTPTTDSTQVECVLDSITQDSITKDSLRRIAEDSFPDNYFFE